jgi:hypothetical protein
MVVMFFALRLLGQPTPPPPNLDAPPPPMADVIAADDTPADDTPADDPADDTDDDDDDDDVALPARLVPYAPPAVAVRPTWSLRSLTDRHAGEPLVPPPRAA